MNDSSEAEFSPAHLAQAGGLAPRGMAQAARWTATSVWPASRAKVRAMAMTRFSCIRPIIPRNGRWSHILTSGCGLGVPRNYRRHGHASSR
jgi:hypothetical protein